MSTLNLENIKHPDSASDNISVDSSGNTNVQGNIGIGGVDPSTLPAFVEHAVGVSNGAGVGIHSANSSDNRWIFFGHGTANLDVQQAGIVNQGSDQSLALATGGTQRMRIDSAGRVTMPYQPCFHIRGGSGYSNAYILFDDVLVDNGNNYSAANGRFTAPVAGYYFISVGMLQNGNTNTNQPEIKLRKNGSEYAASQGQYQSGANWGYASAQGVMYLNVGDYAHAQFNAASSYGSYFGHFAGYLIG